MILLALGCLSDLSTVWGETDPDYSAPTLDLALVDCSDGVVTVEAWTSGEVASVTSDLGDLDLDVEADTWLLSTEGACDADVEVEVTAAGPCEDTSTTAGWSPPSLGSLYPTSGPSSGGTSVVIGLSGEAQSVAFGGQTATFVASTDCDDVQGDTCVVATTPDVSGTWPDGAVVDVAVTLTDGTVLAQSGAFTFNPDRSGMAVLYGRTKLYAFDDAWFWLGSPYTDIGDASSYVQVDMAFHEPLAEDDHVLANNAWPGECANGSWSYDRVSAGTYIELDDNVLLMEDAQYYWYVDTSDGPGLAGHAYDVTVNDAGTSTVDPQTIPGVFVVPELLTSSSFDDPSREFVTGTATTVRGEDLVLTWTADHDMDGLTYSIDAVEGYDVLSSDGCTVDPDSGTLTIPWSQLVSDPGYDDRVDGFSTQLEFWTDVQVTLPHDGSMTWTRSYLVLWTYITVVDE